MTSSAGGAADSVLCEGSEESCGIHHRAARMFQEHWAATHRGERGVADEAFGLGVSGTWMRDEVGGGEELVEAHLPRLALQRSVERR